jgi:uncharacterized zinc-type alcohol dehydrogenase-like protein
MTVKAYGALSATSALEPMTIERRATGARDVRIEIAYCGVCHSDLHTVRSEWAGTLYPCVPGHEIVGHVSEVGAEVTKFKVGDTVGVGCMVDSCQHCHACDEGLEQYCENGFVGTYNAPTPDAPGYTLGGYAQAIVVDEDFVLNVRHTPEQLAAAARCCAPGSPPGRRCATGRRAGQKVGIVGIGGLGHMGVKLAAALGAHTVAFTTSESKREAALALGAHEVIVSRHAEEMAAHTGSFDFILNTVAASHNLDPFIALLKRDGAMCMVGVPEHAHPSPSVAGLIFGRKTLAGSLIGGIAETQEMLDFCAERASSRKSR